MSILVNMNIKMRQMCTSLYSIEKVKDSPNLDSYRINTEIYRVLIISVKSYLLVISTYTTQYTLSWQSTQH